MGGDVLRTGDPGRTAAVGPDDRAAPGSLRTRSPPFSPASEVCAIYPPDRRTGVCKGDSGGPLLLAEPSAAGGMVQIGVASHGYGECATTRPSVFTRVDAISAWVRGWVQALASSPPASASLPADTVAAPTLARREHHGPLRTLPPEPEAAVPSRRRAARRDAERPRHHPPHRHAGARRGRLATPPNGTRLASQVGRGAPRRGCPTVAS